MASRPPVFAPAFRGPESEFDGQGHRPMVLDLLGPDMATSLLPEGLKMVLAVNPSSISFSHSKQIERINTRGGWVEQHWGEATRSISWSAVTGGFKRLYTGLSHVTGGGLDVGGTRRETISYDQYLDLLALFHNNGSIYDESGRIVFQGAIQLTFDGMVYLGWFASFSVTEDAEKPYMFSLSAEFTVHQEVHRLRSLTTL